MKKFKSLLLMVLPVFAMSLSGCVKYNGKESANPVDKATITLSSENLSMEIGDKTTLNATVDRAADIYWEVANDDIISLDAPTGLKVTVSALAQGTTTVSAFVNYNNRKYSSTCTVSVYPKGHIDPPPGPGPGPGPDDPNVPAVGETVTTYLVIGANGRYQGNPGVDIANLFLEYTVEFTAKVGDPLPTKTDVTSTVEGSEFVTWQCYEGGGALKQYTTVPAARGKILYASFGGGNGSVPPGPVIPPEEEGDITFYLAGIGNWPGTTNVSFGINDKYVAATKEASGNYKATIHVKGKITTLHAFLNQGGDGGRYFHPYSGVQDNDKMYSIIKTGTVNLELGGTYTVAVTGWAYHSEDWNDAWFNYTFSSGEPGTVSPAEPPAAVETFTIVFAGIGDWTDATGVHIAVNGNFKDATKQANGQYVATFTATAVTSVNCYLDQFKTDSTSYFHPYNGSYDKMNSTINMGSVAVTAGKTYVITYTGWHDGGHWEWEGSIQHGWFDYSFSQQA